MSISEILKKLLGEIEPYGDTTIDGKRYLNIQNYYEALCFIVAKLKASAKLENRNEYSIKKIARECKDILQEFGIHNLDENARLEDIEDRKVQIEYNNVFNKGVKSVEDKIKAKIEEVKDGTYDAKIVLESLLERSKNVRYIKK